MFNFNKSHFYLTILIIAVFYTTNASAFDFKVCNNTSLETIYVASVFDDLDSGSYSEGWHPVIRGKCADMKNFHGPEVFLRIVGDNGHLLSVPRSRNDVQFYCHSVESSPCLDENDENMVTDTFVYYKEVVDKKSGKISCRAIHDPCKDKNMDFCYNPELTYSFFDSKTALLDEKICADNFDGSLGTFQFYRLKHNNEKIIINDKSIVR